MCFFIYRCYFFAHNCTYADSKGGDARYKSHNNCVMIDNIAWFEFNSGYFPPRKVHAGTVKTRQNRVFALRDKWETPLVGDLFGQIRLGGCFTPTSKTAWQISD